jgi:hypothetical protein
MSRPSSITLPFTFAAAMVSFILFRQRRNVDLPHPEGPISAVIRRSWISTSTLERASLLP